MPTLAHMQTFPSVGEKPKNNICRAAWGIERPFNDG